MNVLRHIKRLTKYAGEAMYEGKLQDPNVRAMVTNLKDNSRTGMATGYVGKE
jgi:hypothetical protein